MWTCLNRPQVWDAAVRFAKADSLSLGRFWIKRGNVPKGEPRTDETGRRELAVAMSAFFREHRPSDRRTSLEKNRFVLAF